MTGLAAPSRIHGVGAFCCSWTHSRERAGGWWAWREAGIARWPYRDLKYIDSCLLEFSGSRAANGNATLQKLLDARQALVKGASVSTFVRSAH